MKKALIFLLLPLLFIGGAVAYYLSGKNQRPTVTEVDTFLRQLPAGSGWRFEQYTPFSHVLVRNPGWWDRIGYRHKTRYERGDYHLIHERTKGKMRLCVWHEAGRVGYVRYHTAPITSPEEKAFTTRFLAGFPELWNSYSYESIRVTFE